MPPDRWSKKKKQPEGFDYVEPILEALENELRDQVKETNDSLRKTEAMWPVHQINWQKSRYIYDLYYVHKRISRAVYDYCIKQKLVDASLIAKWKKPGYERLCSTYTINPTNYKFGTTSICRVPIKDRSPDARNAQDPTTGCRGCASGGSKNIFGNKYGQSLAAVQMAREKREAEVARKRALTEDDTDEDDFGPSPAAGAGSQKLQAQSEAIADGESETDDDDDDEGPPAPKKQKS